MSPSPSIRQKPSREPNDAIAPMIDAIERRIDHVAQTRERPAFVLTYAQSIDGSLAAEPGKRLLLSGSESLVMTHRLRIVHDALLVGVDTVIADDPRLDARLVDGPSPRPIVLDSTLKMPEDSRLFSHPERVLVATTDRAPAERRAQLETNGAEVVVLPSDARGWVDLDALALALRQRDVRSVMVEGGEKTLSSLIAHRLADYLLLTIAPTLVGGLSLGRSVPLFDGQRAHVLDPNVAQIGTDIVIGGALGWDDSDE